MRKLFGLFIMLSILLAAAGLAWAQEDIQQYSSCKYCGMDRLKFAFSRVYIEYDDGTTMGTCSIHCAAVDMALNIDKAPQKILVGDFNEKKLIDAEQASWVIGGVKTGVMTKRAKWAFGQRKAADMFTYEHGGRVATFEEAMKATYEDMYDDSKMIRDRRKMKRMKMMEEKK